MKLLGLTGGIGMGKSTAAGFLLQAGIPVADTDDIAHQLVQPGQPALAEILAAFGDRVRGADGSLNRAEMARVVFSDPAARQVLEAILHPRIRAEWLTRAAVWREQNRPVGVVVIPLLFETQAESQFDRVLCLACSRQSQQQRLLARGWSPEQARQRLAAQWPVERKMALSQYVAWSEGAPEMLRQQLARILGKL